MICINWGNFKAKFYEKESKTFETLAYMLFCSEFGVKNGLFRFKNQTGIETDPIGTEQGNIAFQAKYYDAKISDNKKDIMESIKKAKNKDQSITTIHVYLNQEFSESRKKGTKEPTYKIEMEKFADRIGVSVVWKVPSHFEVILSRPENSHIAEYFFGMGKNAVDFLSEIQAHTQNILFPIQYNIKAPESLLHIDRSVVVDELVNENSGVVILAGEGGSGKTAVIKQISEHSKVPFYVFKAMEFNVGTIAAFFKHYGDYSLKDFIELHQSEAQKTMVIDSAEKLSDLENQDPFKEFLSALLKHNWKIIFTTRLSYLEDLRYQFVEVFQISFHTVKLKNLEPAKLSEMSAEYKFQLPDDKKVLQLITNLFYLDEYLGNMDSSEQKLDYRQFKEALWLKKIQRSNQRKNNIHIEREKCFLLLAKKRAQTGSFYNDISECSVAALSLLEADEVIKYDSLNAGYFITHDIYEEWALDRFVDLEFRRAEDYLSFFESIGTSLSVRRAFRNWLSDRLGDDITSVQAFIENVILATDLMAFWKDEMIVAILSTAYASVFFDTFGEKIMENEKAIVRRILFLLQIGCMQVQDLFIKDAFVKSDLPFLLTQPKGDGWGITISFLWQNKDKFDMSEAVLIIELLKVWTDNQMKGSTTRDSGLLALYFYEKTFADSNWRYSRDLDKKAQKVILSSAIELKEELLAIYEPLLKKDVYKYGDRYFDLASMILTMTVQVHPIASALPKLVIALAEKIWFKSEHYKPNPYESDGYGVEKYYGISRSVHNDYFPASALQTPVYWLLKYATKDTVDFILRFTNKAIEKYASSNVESLKEVELFIDERVTVKQYVNETLWQIYRGSGQFSTPYLLQSVHMALEKFFLENFQNDNVDVYEKWLIYMLKKSRSASITAVVASIALAHPEKLFNILKVLFKTYPFFYYDSVRLTSETRAKGLFSYVMGLNYKNRIFETERIKSFEQSHRNSCLEQVALTFQMIRNEETPVEEFEKRRSEIQQILDGYYSLLPAKYQKDDQFFTLRLLLARLDGRKITPIVKEVGEKVQISLESQLDPQLKKDSQAKVDYNFRNMNHLSLKQWAEQKLKESNSTTEYPHYDGNPTAALEEAKSILEKLNSEHEEQFHLFNHSTPTYVCATLVQFSPEVLSDQDLTFCKEVIARQVVLAFQDGYDYQIGDGVEVAVNALPQLFKLFPNEHEDLRLLLLVILFDEYKLGEYKRVCDYAVEAILNKLWAISSKDAQAIFLAFLSLKPGFNRVRKSIGNNLRRKGLYQKSIHSASVEEWFSEKEPEIEQALKGQLDYSEIRLDDLDMQTLNTAFQMLPSNTNDQIHNRFIVDIIPKACQELLDRDKHDKDIDHRDYTLANRFFRKYAAYMLRRDIDKIPEMIAPLVNNFQYTDEMADVLQEFISEEDMLNSYEQFWLIWKSFFEPIKIFCQSGVTNRFLDKLIDNYLLAWPYWKNSARDWRSLRDRERLFFRDAVAEMGARIPVLHAISQFLNQVGAKFLDDGMIWISDMLEKHPEHFKIEAPVNTIYYLERVARKYVYHHRTSIKTRPHLRSKVVVVLNYLIEKGSVNAYLLREDII